MDLMDLMDLIPFFVHAAVRLVRLSMPLTQNPCSRSQIGLWGGLHDQKCNEKHVTKAKLAHMSARLDL